MKDNDTFESAMAELEELVKKLELGTLTLEGSLEAYENAVSLIKLCTAKLEAAKQRVRILNENANGAVVDTPFIPEDDAT